MFSVFDIAQSAHFSFFHLSLCAFPPCLPAIEPLDLAAPYLVPTPVFVVPILVYFHPSLLDVVNCRSAAFLIPNFHCRLFLPILFFCNLVQSLPIYFSPPVACPSSPAFPYTVILHSALLPTLIYSLLTFLPAAPAAPAAAAAAAAALPLAIAISPFFSSPSSICRAQLQREAPPSIETRPSSHCFNYQKLS